LVARYLSADHGLHEPRQLCVEELRHALLIATNRLGQLRSLAIPNLARERFDPVVNRDLHVFFP
jgi:hypothetical protein